MERRSKRRHFGPWNSCRDESYCVLTRDTLATLNDFAHAWCCMTGDGEELEVNGDGGGVGIKIASRREYSDVIIGVTSNRFFRPSFPFLPSYILPCCFRIKLTMIDLLNGLLPHHAPQDKLTHKNTAFSVACSVRLCLNTTLKFHRIYTPTRYS
jgi:hypothetical protein